MRPSWSGINSRCFSISRTAHAWCYILLVDAACDTHVRSDITRTACERPLTGGSERSTTSCWGAAGRIDALCRQVKINDRTAAPGFAGQCGLQLHRTHGKDLHGQPLGQYWLHASGTGGYRRSRSRGISALLTPGPSLPSSRESIFPRRSWRAHGVRLSGGRTQLIDWLPRYRIAPRCGSAMQGSRKRWTARRSETDRWRCWRCLSEQLLACWKSAREAQGLFSGFDRLSGEVDGGMAERSGCGWLWRYREFLRRAGRSRSVMSSGPVFDPWGERPRRAMVAKAFLERIERGEVGTKQKGEKT